ncbi:MAG TPA: glutathione S-transferase family protein [Candidatus Binatia bacterium]|nr:glutathione S-transferase family protein [Candidatus Binatia bacterium]
MAVRDEVFRLYASEVSYFSAKVRPAFRYKRVPHVELLATAAAYRSVIVPRTGLAMIPVVVTPEGDTWQDSSDILDALERRFPEPPLYPRSPVQRLASYLVEIWVDEFLVLPALHFRWSFPESEAKARADFAATTGDGGRAQRFADAVKGFVRLTGVAASTAPAIEAHTHDLLAILEAHLGEHPYLLGGRPSLADCALMGPLYAHLYLDAVPGRLLRERAPRVCHWIERMNHPDPDASGAWLADDALAPTLLRLLGLVGADAVPPILACARAVDDWADGARPGEEPPRGVGTHRTRLRGVEVERLTTSYTLWMVQRVLDVWTGLDAGARRAVDRALAGTGCEALLAHRPRHRVERRPFKLVLAR